MFLRISLSSSSMETEEAVDLPLLGLHYTLNEVFNPMESVEVAGVEVNRLALIR